MTGDGCDEQAFHLALEHKLHISMLIYLSYLQQVLNILDGNTGHMFHISGHIPKSTRKDNIYKN